MMQPGRQISLIRLDLIISLTVIFRCDCLLCLQVNASLSLCTQSFNYSGGSGKYQKQIVTSLRYKCRPMTSVKETLTLPVSVSMWLFYHHQKNSFKHTCVCPLHASSFASASTFSFTKRIQNLLIMDFVLYIYILCLFLVDRQKCAGTLKPQAIESRFQSAIF